MPTKEIVPEVEEIVRQYAGQMGRYSEKALEEIRSYLESHQQEYLGWTAAFLNKKITRDQLQNLANGEKLVLEAIALKYLLKASIESEDSAKRIAGVIAGYIIEVVIRKITRL